MATQTTYYNFNKPAGTDLVNPLVDTNPNWDALDADLHEFNERSIANCTEVVSLGVHAISRLDTTAKFLKWIATANFTAGDTFVVDGNAVAAATPAGAALATDAYIAGSVVLACLNSDNTAMTIFVSGTNVATDSARLGGELPSYYATDSDMTAAETDITNIQALQGNTSIVGIGDGTLTGAISTLNNDLNDLRRNGAMPVLDYSNPLHTFTSGNLTYTAVKDCYVCGSMCGVGPLAINGTNIADGNTPTVGLTATFVSPIKIKTGDVVTTAGACNNLHVLQEIS
jgi:hypothetical protein